jgi:hypothetical protein
MPSHLATILRFATLQSCRQVGLIEDDKIIENTMRRIGKYQVEYAPSGLEFSMETTLEGIGWRYSNRLGRFRSCYLLGVD